MKVDVRDPTTAAVEQFLADLKRRSIRGSYEIARQTLLLARTTVSQTRWTTAAEIMLRLREIGQRLALAAPSETTIGNIIRRVLHIIREEVHNGDKPLADGTPQFPPQTIMPLDAQQPASPSPLRQDSLVGSGAGTGTTTTPEPRPSVVTATNMALLGDLLSSNMNDDYSKARANLKGDVIQAINELFEELEESASNISKQSLEHIHVHEVIMTIGKSKTVEDFLKAAARKRKFHVIIAESQPGYQGQELAASLAKDGVQTTLITDSAIFAMMSRVNKVIIGTHSIMADGGLMALNGSHALALAAKHHSVPVIVLSAMFKLSPKFLCSYDQNTFNNLVAPSDVLKFKEGDLVGKVHVHNPVFDYVPPELVTLFISNIGANAPSYVYRLLSECYHTEDYDL